MYVLLTSHFVTPIKVSYALGGWKMMNNKIGRISLELAEILGLLCAEGSHIISYSSYKEKNRDKFYYRKNKKSERIEFYNKDTFLLNHYRQLLKKEFGYEANITKHGKINIGQKQIIENIISQTALGHLNWRVPEAVLSAEEITKLCFLRGYFDGDGTASGRIRFFSTNLIGLKQVSQLLDNLELKHTMQGPIIKPNRKPSYVIQISRKEEERFLKMIRPVSKRPTMQGSTEKS